MKIDPPARPRADARRDRVLVVQQPLVGAERPVEPHRVVEARHAHAGRVPRQPERQHARVEQRHVAGVGDDARVQHRVVGQCGRRRATTRAGRRLDVPLRCIGSSRRRSAGRSGAGARSQRRSARGTAPGARASRAATPASGTSGGASIWWSSPGSWPWKLACRLKIARPCWIATTRRVLKLRAVAEAVDVVDDRHRRVAGAQEVGVQRVHESRSSRRPCGPAATSAWPAT